ncbi:hypothetical protein [Candidatus Regiella insecticola]|uniref:hypothetical protein n=1 Tax=Candidatus Regiella insecticola TaxID=138073 RepID=UPI0015967FF6|nr:hypothetical protein [Candidatus Regiella insecticola]
MTSKEDYFSPLNGEIPLYPVEELEKIANHVRLFLRMNKRTDKQIKYIQNLIYQLIEIYCHYELKENNKENTDTVDALGEIVHWLKDDETEDGFIDAEPCEYFYVLSLSLINDAVSFIKLLDQRPIEKEDIKISVCMLHPITRAAMKAYKAMCYGDKIKTEAMHESQLNKLYKENSLLKKN